MNTILLYQAKELSSDLLASSLTILSVLGTYASYQVRHPTHADQSDEAQYIPFHLVLFTTRGTSIECTPWHETFESITCHDAENLYRLRRQQEQLRTDVIIEFEER